MEKTRHRFYLLDPLRFVAAIAVLFYHYSIYFTDQIPELIRAGSQYGYLGVVFFFMLSGFVISASAENSTPASFIVARAKRLYPAFIACLLISVATSYLLFHKGIPLHHFLLNALIINDYFSVPNYDGVYWTLQAELKFYGCIFALLLFNIFKYFRWWLSLWLAIACLHFYTLQPFFMGWFINPNYSFYFIAGVCAFMLHRHPKDWLLHLLFIISGLFGVKVAGVLVTQFLPHPSEWATEIAQGCVVSFFVFFYVLSHGFFNIKKAPFGWGYLGALSYPLYLLHNRFGKSLIEYFSGIAGHLVAVYAVAALVILIAFLVHVSVEKPLQRIFSRRRKLAAPE